MGCVYYCTDEFAAEKKMIGRGRKFGARIVYEEGATDTRWGERKNKKEVWEGERMLYTK